MKIDPEEIILACVLYDEDRVEKVAKRLSPEQFHDERNRLIFSAMVSIHSQGVDVNLITLKAALSQLRYKHLSALEYVGESYLSLLTVGVSPFNEAFNSALLDLMARPKKEPEHKVEKEEEWPDEVV